MRRFTISVEQEEVEEETGESSSKEATNGEEDAVEGVETEVSQSAEKQERARDIVNEPEVAREEEQRGGEDVVEEAEVERTGEVGVVFREEELGSVRDVTVEEFGLSETVDVKHLTEVVREVAKAEREEEEQLVFKRRGRHEERVSREDSLILDV